MGLYADWPSLESLEEEAQKDRPLDSDSEDP